MKPLGTHNYFVYIVTNLNKTVLYTGVTDNLRRRIYEHKEDSKSSDPHFAGKYKAYHLIYWERFEYIQHAIMREKQIKGWKRFKKVAIINEFNPEWKFLNEELD
jgi:putative endonuclease